MDIFCKRKFLTLLTCLFLFIFQVQKIEAMPLAGRPFTSSAFGYAWGNLHGSSYILSDPFVPFPYNRDRYSLNAKSNFNVALSAGMQWQNLISMPYVNILLRYLHQFNLKANGSVTQYGLPEFRNYDYSMKLVSDAVHLIGKINFYNYQQFLPYFSLGLGMAQNRSYHYDEHPLANVFPGRVSPNFSQHTSEKFSYLLGAGIDYVWNNCVWVTLGYEFLNLGKVHSGHGVASWAAGEIDFGTLKTNNISLGVTYFFA